MLGASSTILKINLDFCYWQCKPMKLSRLSQKNKTETFKEQVRRQMNSSEKELIVTQGHCQNITLIKVFLAIVTKVIRKIQNVTVHVTTNFLFGLCELNETFQESNGDMNRVRPVIKKATSKWNQNTAQKKVD